MDMFDAEALGLIGLVMMVLMAVATVAAAAAAWVAWRSQVNAFRWQQETDTRQRQAQEDAERARVPRVRASVGWISRSRDRRQEYVTVLFVNAGTREAVHLGFAATLTDLTSGQSWDYAITDAGFGLAPGDEQGWQSLEPLPDRDAAPGPLVLQVTVTARDDLGRDGSTASRLVLDRDQSWAFAGA